MKRTIRSDRIKLKRYREASEWLLRVNHNRVTEPEIEQWLRWCQADAENLSAFEKLLEDWRDTAGFKSAPELLNSAKHTMDRRERHASAASSPRPWRSSPLRWAVAASVLFAAIVGYSLSYRQPVHEVTANLYQEPATLPDGSLLTLSAKATADVDFSGIARRVALRPGGEAYIKVRHDKSRPFTVHAGAMTVTAVGTAFDVRREADRVIVTVEEGTIVASAIGTNGLNEWRAGAGYQIEYSERVKTAVVARVDAQSVLRWRDGELAYEDAPLEAVVADINRYSVVTVAVKDPALLHLRFTGTVFVASVNDWVKALESKYPVQASVAPNGVISLDSPIAAPAVR